MCSCSSRMRGRRGHEPNFCIRTVLVNPSSSTAINMCSTIPASNICALSPVNPGISAAVITPLGNLRLYVPIASLSYLVKEVAFSWCIALPQDRLCSPAEAFLLLIRITDTRYLTSSGRLVYFEPAVHSLLCSESLDWSLPPGLGFSSSDLVNSSILGGTYHEWPLVSGPTGLTPALRIGHSGQPVKS
ncbi:uncharacterized protein BO96DRAFT_476209 [Aspergillus niger CBS 101883]|uniref:uncharacterized protein n=1 Tax=Aspergillus lacticoffeatus (strain CBS 101883) TaxID=1450533 RepID=UPI000D7FFAD3|nr:uncharacterized protein BO96DRAFT_476209 [Aspergillus niger CBS 101883]PYH55883.1 hypothetical protein BO96DRAFT_476209 [Aspergillus niger CBS 101883]